MKKLLLGFVVSIFCSYSFAGIITHGDYSLDTDTNIITNTVTNLEWLQWDETVGMTINDAMASNIGWSLASNSQAAELFNDFSLAGSGTFTDTETTTQSFVFPYTSGIDPQDIFISLFGITRSYTVYDYESNIVDARDASVAYFGSDVNNDNNYNLAVVQKDATGSHYNGSYVVTPDYYSAQSVLIKDFFSISSSAYDRGVALVRDPNAVSAPEPATLPLLFTSLILLFRRNIKIRIKEMKLKD